MKVVIIGGGTAGSEVAWRLRQQNKNVKITILEKGPFTQYSPCALPYLISGEIKNFSDIFLFDKNFYSQNQVNLKTECLVKSLNRKKQTIFYEENGQIKTIDYDKLVITSGSKFVPPKIPGLSKVSYLTLTKADDAQKIKQQVKSKDKALIIGAGYIGIELANSLSSLGLEVSILEAKDRVLPINFDLKMASKIQTVLEANKIKVITEAQIKKIASKEVVLKGQTLKFDHLFVCCGLLPNTDLAIKSGLKCDQGIIIDSQGRTSDKKIYACGDAVESINLIDDSKALSQLATTAVRQARVIASNILKIKKENNKVLGTNISEFKGFIFGSTGVTESYCKEKGIKTVSALYQGESRAEYHPKSQVITVKIISNLKGRIIGCQIAGHEEIAGRINMVALAIKQKMDLKNFILSETCYNPAIAPIFDPVIIATEICLKKLDFKHGTKSKN